MTSKKPSKRIEYSPVFVKRITQAPKEIKLVFRNTLELFRDHPDHPMLRGHKLQGAYQDLISIDLTDDWRALYREEPERILFVNIGTHKQLYG